LDDTTLALDDSALAAAAARGDQTAFSLLAERYRAYIYTIAWRIALNEDDALDIAQNVLLRLVEKIGLFGNRGSFRGWLATLTAHEAMSYLRRTSRRMEIATEPGNLGEIAERQHIRSNGYGSEKPWEKLEAAHRKAMVESAVESLSPQQRAIFLLRFREDMLPAAIAEQLEIPSRQVRSQLHRAVQRIRETVAEDQGRGLSAEDWRTAG
jgi:RNA polymerase sigma-70 factor, ECF subfamily